MGKVVSMDTIKKGSEVGLGWRDNPTARHIPKLVAEIERLEAVLLNLQAQQGRCWDLLRKMVAAPDQYVPELTRQRIRSFLLNEQLEKPKFWEHLK